MDHSELVDATARELGDLHAALADGPVEAGVPTCEGWAVSDLANHIGEFCGFWSHVLCEGSGRPKTPFPDRPDDHQLVAWVEDLGAGLVAELRETPPDTPVWTWYEADQTARFVARRCAHELAVHRYDAESARGRSRPIEPHLAADGIAELLGPLLTVRPRSGEAAGETLHLHGTDHGVEAEWLVTLGVDRIDVDRRHAKGDLALRGTVSDLELLLLDRPTLGTVERHGDESVLDVWYREFRF